MKVFTPVTRYSAGAAAESEPADHGISYHKVHLTHRRRRPLSFQDLKEVAVKWFIFF